MQKTTSFFLHRPLEGIFPRRLAENHDYWWSYDEGDEYLWELTNNWTGSVSGSHRSSVWQARLDVHETNDNVSDNLGLHDFSVALEGSTAPTNYQIDVAVQGRRLGE